jgi:hypothetical protein
MSIGVMNEMEMVLWGGETPSPGGGAPSPLPGVTTVRPDPTAEYVAGGHGYFRGMGEAILPPTIDDLTVKLGGYRGYDLMLQMPAVGSSVKTLILGALAGEIKLTPTFSPRPGAKRLTRDEKRAADAVDFCQRLMNRVRNWRSGIQQLCSAVHRGNKLAEMTGRIETAGPDAGRLVLKSFNVKPHTSWQFIINESYEVTGILYRDRDGLKKRAPVEKFAWITWMPEDNDPRGTSILRAAYAAWSLAVKLYPQYYKYLCQFAVASLVGEVSPTDTGMRVVDGVTLNPNQYFKLILERFQNCSVVIVPSGSKVTPIEVKGEGLAFLNAFEYFNREIIYAILLQARATKEAENGSKKDSETATDVMDLIIEYLQSLVGEVIRQHVLHEFLRLNFGDQFADAYTPYVFPGSGPAADKIEKWKAAAPLLNGGAIPPSIRADFYADAIGYVPDEEEDAKAEEEAMARAQKAQAVGEEEEDDDGGEVEPEEEEGLVTIPGGVYGPWWGGGS